MSDAQVGIQRTPAPKGNAGKWIMLALVAGAVLLAGIVYGVFQILKHSEAYQLGVARLQTSPLAASVLGTPITAGTPSGSVNVQSGGTGQATLNFPASGPKAAGTVYLEAVKRDDVWSITRFTLKLDGSDKAIDLINAAKSGAT
jgi:hypothetical protein